MHQDLATRCILTCVPSKLARKYESELSLERSPAKGSDQYRPITAAVVARLAGVSQSAVSRVFTPGASVSKETRARVESIALKVGYRPNLIARSLITGRSNMIGVAVPGTDNPFYQAAVEALAVAFSRSGYRVLLFTTDPATGSDPVLEEVLRYRVDALVLISTNLSSRLADDCMQVRVPVVMLNRTTDSRSVSSVVGSNRQGAHAIAAFLLAAKHKRFGYVAGLENSSTNRDREEGFFEYLRSQGVHSVRRENGGYTFAGAQAATRIMLSSKRPPDAIFCANDYMALAAINVAQAEFGLVVGQQISVVGFDNIHLSEWPLFKLTTYSQPLEAMARRVLQIIEKQICTLDTSSAAWIEEGELIVRESARKPKIGLRASGDHVIWCPPPLA